MQLQSALSTPLLLQVCDSLGRMLPGIRGEDAQSVMQKFSTQYHMRWADAERQGYEIYELATPTARPQALHS